MIVNEIRAGKMLVRVNGVPEWREYEVELVPGASPRLIPTYDPDCERVMEYMGMPTEIWRIR